MAICRNCGAETDTRFCPKCGAKIEEDVESDQVIPDDAADAGDGRTSPDGPHDDGQDVCDDDVAASDDSSKTSDVSAPEPPEEEGSPSTDSDDSPEEDGGEDGVIEQDTYEESKDVASGNAGDARRRRTKAIRTSCVLITLAIVLTVVATLFSTHVICIHDWEDATCTEPRTCSICGRTEGSSLGHTWEAATCVNPETCSRCGATKGSALGHTWVDATCTEPKTCSVCGATEGDPLGHDFVGLSCTTDGTCSRCGEVSPATGHTWVDATCTEPKTCSVCGATEGDPLGHTTDNGVCSRCGLEVYARVSGSGDSVASDLQVGDGIYRLHMTNSGSSNFAVWAYDAAGDRDLLANTIGSYDGSVLLLGTAPYSLEITSSGTWSYQVERVGTTDQTSFSGKGDYVTDMFSASSGAWRFTHDGSGNFAVWAYTTSGRDLLVNDIGAYDGTRMLNVPAGSYVLFEITADGNWTAAPEG